MVTATLPPISPSLQASIRAYALANGYKNAARALAFGPVVDEAPRSATVAKRRNGTNGRIRGRKLPLACIWFEDGRLRHEEYPKGTEDLWLVQAHKLDATRFSREQPWPFGAARPETAHSLDRTDTRLSRYYPRHCCDTPMGIMEAWDGANVTAVYQCAANAKHHRPAMPKNVCSTCGCLTTTRADLKGEFREYATWTCGACDQRAKQGQRADCPGMMPVALIRAQTGLVV